MIPLNNVLSTHKQLFESLIRVDPTDALQWIGGLGTIPKLHANTLRVEALAHFSAWKSRGTTLVSAEDVISWLHPLLTDSPLASLEDPPEDIFIGCVNTSHGSFRVFSGIFADGDFWVERLCALLYGKRNYPGFDRLHDEAIALLRLSDRICGRLSLPRYADGGGDAGAPIQSLDPALLRTHFASVRFGASELQKLGISAEHLNRFAIDLESCEPVASGDSYVTLLESKPIVRIGDEIVVALPSSIARALTHFLAESIYSALGKTADDFYSMESAQTFVNAMKARLGIKPLGIDVPDPPGDLPPLFPYFGQFDYGKGVILLSFTPSLLPDPNNPSIDQGLSRDQMSAIRAYLRQCCAQFEVNPEFVEGIVLLSVAGIGRDLVIPIPEPGEKWSIAAAPLPDWLTLVEDRGFDSLRLWTFLQNEKLLEKYSIHLFNPFGMLHLFAFWKESTFSLLHPQIDITAPPTLIHIDTDSGCRLRTKLRKQADEHCVLKHGGKGFSRLRRHTRTLNPEDSETPIYGDIELVAQERLLGCSERTEIRWWVAGPDHDYVGPQRTLLFELWECVLNWVDKASPMLNTLLEKVEAESVLITLNLPGFEHWDFGKGRHPQSGHSLVAVANPTAFSIELTVRESFLKEFNQPENKAEQRILSEILSAAATIGGKPVEDAFLEKACTSIMGGTGARYFHVVETSDLAHLDARRGKANPNLLSEEVVALLEIGLADLLERPEDSRVRKKKPARKYLHDLTAKIWERIEFRLRELQHAHVVHHCFNELDEIARDQFRWDLSTRALLALDEDKRTAPLELRRRMGKTAIASLANRLIIETAQYCCPEKEGRIISKTDHSVLLAEFDILLRIAAHCDAITEGFMKPSVDILPNGTVRVNEEFYEGVFGPYLTERADRDVVRAEANYEEFFGQGQVTSEKHEKDKNFNLKRFAAAFEAEYQFKFEKLIEFAHEVGKLCISVGNRFGEFPEGFLRQLLASELRLDQHQATALIEALTLPIRSGWNRDLPPRTEEADVYPWRYRRALSVYARPLVQTGKSPRKWMMSASFLQKSVRFFLGNLAVGKYPDRLFYSDVMKAYIGDEANRRGHNFAKRVHRRFLDLGYTAKLEVELTELGAKECDGLGDVDVLAWDPPSNRVFVTECKHLIEALTVSDAVERLQEFRGDIEKKDALGRHLRRIEWLRENRAKLSEIVGIEERQIVFEPLLVTNDLVPMQFFKDLSFPFEQFTAFNDLPTRLGTPT